MCLVAATLAFFAIGTAARANSLTVSDLHVCLGGPEAQSASACEKLVSDSYNSETASQIFARRGDLLMKAGEFEKAAASYSEAIKRLPRHWMYTKRGVAHDRAGRRAEAMEDWKTATALDRRDSVASYNIGISLFAGGKCPEAVPYLQASYELERKSLRFALALAEVSLCTKNFDRALKLFGQATNVPSKSSDEKDRAAVGYALALAGSGRATEALVAAEQIISTAPSLSRGHEARGVALVFLNRFSDARTAFTRAVELDNSNKTARKLLQQIP